jgi:hypothetical protein
MFYFMADETTLGHLMLTNDAILLLTKGILRISAVLT